MSGHGAVPGWVGVVAARYKAIAATLVPLVGGVLFLVSTGDLDVAHLAGVLAISLGAGGVTHQVPNAG